MDRTTAPNNPFKPTSEPPFRRYRELRISEDGVALSGRIAGPTYWFERHEVGIHPGGEYWREPGLATIYFVVDGKTSVLFYLCGRRIDTCTFAYDLRPHQVSAAVVAMRRARLTRFIRPAAEWALREMPKERRSVLAPALRRLLRPLAAKEKRR